MDVGELGSTFTVITYPLVNLEVLSVKEVSVCAGLGAIIVIERETGLIGNTVVEGLDKVIIIDARDYPSRGVDEPAKEKSLRISP